MNTITHKERLIKAPEAVCLVVKQLVVKSWDAKLSALSRDAAGLYHSRIQINNVYIVNNNNLKNVYEKGYMASLQSSLQIRTSSSNFDKTKIKTSQILDTIADLQHNMFALRRYAAVKHSCFTELSEKMCQIYLARV